MLWCEIQAQSKTTTHMLRHQTKKCWKYNRCCIVTCKHKAKPPTTIHICILMRKHRLQDHDQEEEPPGGTLGYGTCAQVAGSTKLRKKIGSSVAYKTIGTFPSKVRRKDAHGQSTKQAKAGAVQRYEATTAKRWYPDPTIDYTLSSLMRGNAGTPSPRGRSPRRIGLQGSNRGVREDRKGKS